VRVLEQFYSGLAPPNVKRKFTHGQPRQTQKHCPKTLPRKTEGRESRLKNLRSTELARNKALLKENKKVTNWAVDTHTCQQRQWQGSNKMGNST
jgi:hypothetical protein